MWFRTVWVNKHWKCPPAVRSIYFLPRAGLGINTQLSHKHTKQQISLTFPQNIHHLFVPREKEESDREMRMSSMPVLGGSFSWPAGLCLKWTPGPVSSPDPCMGNHTSLCRLQATTSNSSCTTKRREKREAVILDVLSWWLALWHLTSSKTIDTPVTVILPDGTWRGLSAFIISLELLFLLLTFQVLFHSTRNDYDCCFA